MTTTPLMWVGRLLHTLGLILLVHAGYSAVEHLGYLKLVGRTEKSLPVEMIVECLVSVLLSIVGVVLLCGKMKEIGMEDELAKRPMDTLSVRPAFRSLQHRGKILFQALDS